jgi:hypothetical protein
MDEVIKDLRQEHEQGSTATDTENTSGSVTAVKT